MFLRKMLGLVCVLMVCGLLAAGLSPFNPFPRNEVFWLNEGKGLEFGAHGLVISSDLLSPSPTEHDSYCSLQIRLQPKRRYVNNSSTILVFYTPDNPVQFRLMQYGDELLFRRNYHQAKNRFKNLEIEMESAFTNNEPVSFTITSGPEGAVAYRNGVRAGASRRMGLSCNDFAGQLVIGNSPISDNAWQGRLLDLAIYKRELTPQEISRDYAAINAGPPLQGLPDLHDNIVARYDFAEGSGKVIHNREGFAPDLQIPAHFRILHKQFLAPPWKEFRPDNGYVNDVAINIAGFIPFGFLLAAYLSWNRQGTRAATLTILAGAAISVTIEVLQVFIPSRTSGVTDIITNTLGTALGVLLCNWGPVQTLTVRLRRLRPSIENGRIK